MRISDWSSDVCSSDLRNARLFERVCTRSGSAGVCEVDITTVLMLYRFSGTSDTHDRPVQTAGDFGASDDKRPPAVSNHTAIQAMQGIGANRGVQHIVDAQYLAQLSFGIDRKRQR